MLACEPFSEQTKSIMSSPLGSLLPSSDIKFGSSSWHCPSVTIPKFSHLPVDDFVGRKSFSE